jgi:integrase
MAPYYKTSHRAWYVSHNGKTLRLGVNEEEARQAYDRLIAQHSDFKVSEIVEKFLSHHRKISAVATVRYCEQLNRLVKHLGSLRVHDIKPYHLTQLLEDGKIPSCLIKIAKSCFRWAEQQELIEHSPLRNLKTTTSTARGDEVYLTPDQWEAFLREVPNDLSDFVTVMRDTGCRPQEIRQVESRHFDRAQRCWIFPRLESKGKRQNRIVHLSHIAFEICQRLALKYPDGPIFRNSEGNPWSTAALDGRFDRISSRLGFKVVPYSLRHLFITEAIIHDVDLQSIATIVGHADLKMISRVYQHLNRRGDHLKRALQKAIA